MRSPNWSIEEKGERIVISGGADAIYAVTDSDKEMLKKFLQGKSETSTGVVMQLKNLGVFGESIKKSKMKLVWVGKPDEKIKRLVMENCQDFAVEHERPDIILLIRTNGDIHAYLRKYRDRKIPHLSIDLSFHHTFSLGPLVYAGESACISCLFERINSRWEEFKLPEEPKCKQENPLLVAGMICQEVQKISAGRFTLLNRIVAYDLENYKLHDTKIYIVPWCKYCQEPEYPLLGSLKLPWKK